eukprot:CAMPEP_0179237918 /NCGR_PEP_ID=MMETSP0797-20121207/14685_1 /TAXON_ID=47934 /ORGANISM="Dinophysis acuminata, Strain DAEP01" /LENGTH=181 /DNA_ID=CAMNT_0020945209 /DNA_START=61 /DNA_END=604 /DNA_ORIENTATION=+
MLRNVQWLSDVKEKVEKGPYDADQSQIRERSAARGVSLFTEVNAVAEAVKNGEFDIGSDPDDDGGEPAAVAPPRPRPPAAARHGPQRPSVDRRARPKTAARRPAAAVKEQGAGHAAGGEQQQMGVIPEGGEEGSTHAPADDDADDDDHSTRHSAGIEQRVAKRGSTAPPSPGSVCNSKLAW